MKKINLNLLIYIFIILIKQFFFLFNPSSYFNYFLLFLLFIIILKEEEKNYLPVILFFHPCVALFDDTSFTYFFNIIIFIFTLKLFFNLKNSAYKINKKLLVMVLVLFSYELLLNLLYGYMNTSLLSLCSWLCSYLFVVLYVTRFNDINFNKCLSYFFLGYLFGAIGGIAIPISNYGLVFPSRYRFTGLFRDPNVFSLDALLIIFSSLKIDKKISFRVIVTVILGCFSISKMFLFVLVISMLIYFIQNINKISPKKIITFMVIIVFICFIGIRFSVFDTLYSKYTDRFDTEELSTGRTVIAEYYLERLKDEPVKLIFGSTALNYNNVLYTGTGNLSHNFVAHNTYFDLLLSWGIFGSVYYMLFLNRLFSLFKYKYSNGNKLFYSIPLLLAFMLSLFSLSFLSADIFIIFVLYLLIMTYVAY